MPINRELSQFGSFVEVANSTKLGIVDPNVGIGTTNPTVKVEVHGDIKVVDGNIDANGNLDVDGYSDLDELNVTGIATFTNGIQCSGSAMNVTAGFVANTARVSDLTDNRVVIAGNSGELEDNSNFTFDGSTLSVGADFTLTGIDTGSSAGPEFKLYRNSSSPDDGDYLGQIKFAGESDTGVERNYAKITGKILDASNGTEDGILEFAHIKAGSQNISARFRSDSLQLLNGTNFSVAGDSTLTGDLDVDGHTDLDFVAVSAAATFSSLVDVNGGLEANTAKIGDLTDNRVVIAGVGGELEDNSKFTFNDETVNINAQLTVSGVSTFSGGLSMGSGSIGLTTNSITGPAEMFIDPAAVGDNTGVVRIKGDLYVDGTTTQINSETLTIADFVVGIASTATTDSLADGAGINIGPDNTFKYDHTNTSLKSSENLNVASGKTYKINGTDVLSATTLGSAVVSSSLTSVGTLSALTVSGDVSIADKIIHTGDTNTAIRFPAADTFTVETAGAEALRIDSGGRVLQGLTSAKFGFFNDNNAPPVHQIQGDTYYNTAFSIFRDGVGGSGPNFILAKGRGAIVQDDDDLGTISFQGHDGTTELIEGAKIFAEVGGTPGSNNMPTDLVFNTNSGASTSSERLRITSAGLVGINTTPGTLLELKGESSKEATVTFNRSPVQTTNDGVIGEFLFENATDSVALLAVKRESAADDAYIQFATQAAGGGLTEKLRIRSTGWQESHAAYAAVGINTFASWARTGGAIRAEVGYNAETTDYIYFGTGTNHPVALRVNNDTALYIKNDSNRTVGIGTENPSVADGTGIHIAGTSAGIKLQNTNDGDWGFIEYADESNTTKFIQGYRDANGTYSIRPGTTINAQPGITLISDGKVGINSVTPAVKLDIRSTDAIRVPVGTTGERPTGAAGYIRYNSSIASYEGHNGSEWAGIGGAAEVETAVSSTSATTCESFAKASYRSATIIAQITQGSSYQVGNYLLIHDGTTATLVEESAVATGDMLGTFTATISGSNVVFQVNMSSASSATVTTKMTKVSIP